MPPHFCIWKFVLIQKATYVLASDITEVVLERTEPDPKGWLEQLFWVVVIIWINVTLNLFNKNILCIALYIMGAIRNIKMNKIKVMVS